MREYNRADDGAAPPQQHEVRRALLAEAGVDDASSPATVLFEFHDPMGTDGSSTSIMRALSTRLFMSALPLLRRESAAPSSPHSRQQQVPEPLDDRVNTLRNTIPYDLRQWTPARNATTLTYTLFREQLDEPLRRAFYASLRDIGVGCRRVPNGYRLTLPLSNRERFVNGA